MVSVGLGEGRVAIFVEALRDKGGLEAGFDWVTGGF